MDKLKFINPRHIALQLSTRSMISCKNLFKNRVPVSQKKKVTVAITNKTRSMWFGEIIVVYCEISIKHINKLCRQNGESLFLEAGGFHSQVLFETGLGPAQK